MKRHISLIASVFLCLGLLPASAQFGRPGNVSADSLMTRVFGTNLNFSATVNIQINMPAQDNELAMTGKIFFAGGNSRMEMDMTKMSGNKLPPHVADQMKAMGMDQMISISKKASKITYLIYPGLDSYTQVTVTNAETDVKGDQIKTIQLGKETLDGHPCLKNQYTVTNTEAGGNLVMDAWIATDMKNCPLKIEINSPESDSGKKARTITTLHFTDINTATPAASLFEPPVGYRVYTDVQAMVQTELMRKMAGANGMTPGHPDMPANHPATPPAGHP